MKNMTYRRRLLLAAALIASLGVTAIGVGTTFAASNAAAQEGGVNHLVEAIATRFHVSVTDVQAVFDEERATMEADRDTREAARLTEAVTAGTLTQAQADLLSAKHAEMSAFMETMKDKTPEERNVAMKAKMDELKTWAAEQGIPEGFFLGEPGKGGPHGPGGMMHGGRGMHGMGGMMHGGEADDAFQNNS